MASRIRPVQASTPAQADGGQRVAARPQQIAQALDGDAEVRGGPLQGGGGDGEHIHGASAEQGAPPMYAGSAHVGRG